MAEYNALTHELHRNRFLFTSESVGEGHPDKICDQISDAILDACLAQDADSRVAVETATKTGMILVFGEVSTRAHLDYQAVVRRVIQEIGYDDSAKGFDYRTCNILVAIEHQSPDIANSLINNNNNNNNNNNDNNNNNNNIELTNYVGEHHLNNGDEKDLHLGAGDQGLMFGYATDETPELMPLTLMLSHRIIFRLRELRRSGELDWLRPDCKAQVTVEYEKEGGAVVPRRVHTVVISAQHAASISTSALRDALMEKVVKTVIPPGLVDSQTIFHLQPSGRFVIGGPQGDAGLTGRKIIVDTYGGWGAHGGGAFSGKDWSKVDRSGAYAARWVAKSLVASGLCRRCLIQISYAIGIAEPLSIYVDSYGTATEGLTDADLVRVVRDQFDLRPGAIVKQFKMRRPMFQATACGGHFGRSEFPWEQAKNLKGHKN